LVVMTFFLSLSILVYGIGPGLLLSLYLGALFFTVGFVLVAMGFRNPEHDDGESTNQGGTTGEATEDENEPTFFG